MDRDKSADAGKVGPELMAGENRLDQLVATWDEVIRKAFLDAVYLMRSGADIAQLVRMLENRDVDGALRAVGLDPVQFRPFDKAIADAYEAGGNFGAKAIPPKIDPVGHRLIVMFDVRNPEAEAWLRDYSSGLVTEILTDQRTAIKETLTAAMALGNNPKVAALDLVGRIGPSGKREGGVIGLTSGQAEWVRRYEAELASNAPGDALSRNLRDRRFDSAVKKAQAAGKPIPAEQRAKMVAAYRNRALKYRGEVIGRTEAMTALHQAQHEAMRQAIDKGVVQQSAVTKIWHSAADSRVRETHRHLNGQKVAFGKAFKSDLGPIRFPGDPEASAANTIQCRCTLFMHVDFLAGVT